MSTSEPPNREHAPASTARDTRIEQLLLAGLDRYFAGEFEHAIQVWSRVFFLDRGHARARAYIERARGALAERQREAEARIYRTDFSKHSLLDSGTLRMDLDVGRESANIFRRELPLGPPSPAVALAVVVEEAERRGQAELSHAVPTQTAKTVIAEPLATQTLATRTLATLWRARQRWGWSITQMLLVLLAAALLFGAGYVVAARDQLATWWAESSAPDPSLPVITSESSAGQKGAGPVRQHGSASR
jgi:hypothetical protein